jgi:flavin reductase (DIM6/NTAB) family NADH-FMN oxidoreductase RutF
MAVVKSDVPGAKAYRLIYPRPVVLVSCMDPETARPNIITIAWSVPLSINPPLVGILVAPRRYSHELIERSKEFVINVPTMELLEKAIKCGKVSGRGHDKFAEFGFTPKPGRMVRAPYIEECVAHIECRLANQVSTGDHTLFIGEVVAACADEEAFDGNFINIERTQNIFQVGGDVYATLSGKRFTPRP